MKTGKICVVVALLCACRPGERRSQGGESRGTPTKAATIGGFQTPESVLWDSAQDVYYVSNINGNPSEKDGNGYISVIDSSGAVKYTIKGLDAVGPDGALYITDTAIRFGSQGAEHVGTDRIFRVTEGYLHVSVALQTDSL